MSNENTVRMIERLRKGLQPTAGLREAAAKEQGMMQDEHRKRQAAGWLKHPDP